MPEESVRAAVDAISRRLQEELELQLSLLQSRHDEALSAARSAAEADGDARWAAKLEALSSEWTARLERELAAARADGDSRLAEESARIHEDAERTAAEAIARVTQQADAEREALASERLELLRSLEAARSELDGVRHALAAARQEVEETRGQFERAREDRDRAIAELEQTRDALDGERADAEGDRAALATLREEHGALAAARDSLHGLLEKSRGDADALRLDLEAASAGRLQLEAVLEDVRRERDEIGRAEAQREQAAAAAALEARIVERTEQLAIVERLLGAVRSFDSARSLSDVLTALAGASAAEARRVVLFVRGREGFRVWSATGFAETPAPAALQADDATLLGRALLDRVPVTSGPDAPPLPEFAALPPGRAAIAVPLNVGPQPVALLYADAGADGDREAPASWPEAIQILARHAAVHLAHLTAVRTADALRRPVPAAAQPGTSSAAAEDGASARRYARLLLSEIKMDNETAVQIGRQNRDLLQRLRPEIDRARTLYRQRIPSAVDSQGVLFQQELVRTLADGDPALLGT